LKFFHTQCRPTLPLTPDPPVKFRDDKKGGTTVKIAIWRAFLSKSNSFSHPRAPLPAPCVPAGPSLRCAIRICFPSFPDSAQSAHEVAAGLCLRWTPPPLAPASPWFSRRPLARCVQPPYHAHQTPSSCRPCAGQGSDESGRELWWKRRREGWLREGQEPDVVSFPVTDQARNGELDIHTFLLPRSENRSPFLIGTNVGRMGNTGGGRGGG
jgi:hypothetical protein